jgi:hypothetical protein
MQRPLVTSPRKMPAKDGMIGVSPGSDISPVFFQVLCGEIYLAVPSDSMGFRLIGMIFIDQQVLGIRSLCCTTLGPDINATYLTPAVGRGFQTHNSQLAPTCRRVSFSTCALFSFFSFILTLASSCIFFSTLA